MSVRYNAVLWNRQKKVYDVIVAALSISYLVTFVGLGTLIHPNATIETLLNPNDPKRSTIK